MEISDIRIRLLKNTEGRLKAVASIIIDGSFAIHDIKILERTEGYFIAMPCRKTPDGEFKDIAHPINSETRALLSDLILKAFKTELSKPPSEYTRPAPKPVEAEPKVEEPEAEAAATTESE